MYFLDSHGYSTAISLSFVLFLDNKTKKQQLLTLDYLKSIKILFWFKGSIKNSIRQNQERRLKQEDVFNSVVHD